eukprot:3588672-Heterocapsa_arctica.AAC.1
MPPARRLATQRGGAGSPPPRSPGNRNQAPGQEASRSMADKVLDALVAEARLAPRLRVRRAAPKQVDFIAPCRAAALAAVSFLQPLPLPARCR